jgi:hypothetical protein
MAEVEDRPYETPMQARARQEREVAVAHALTSAEYVLAREGAQVGRILASAGLEFDALTFVALRVVEAVAAEGIDPVDALKGSTIRGLIARSAHMTDALLARGVQD